MRFYLSPPVDGLNGAALLESPNGEASVGTLFGGEEIDYRLDDEAGFVVKDDDLTLTLSATRSPDAPAPLYLSASLIFRETRTELLAGEDPTSEEPTVPPGTPAIGVLQESVLWNSLAEEVGVGSGLYLEGRSRSVASLGRAGWETSLVLRLRLVAGAGAENFPATLGIPQDNYLDAPIGPGASTSLGLYTRERFRFFVRRERIFLHTRDNVIGSGSVPLYSREYFRGEEELRLYTRERISSDSAVGCYTRDRLGVAPDGFDTGRVPSISSLVIDDHAYATVSASGVSASVPGAPASDDGAMYQIVDLAEATDRLRVPGKAIVPPSARLDEAVLMRGPEPFQDFGYLAKAAQSLLGAVGALAITSTRVPGSPVEVMTPSDTDAGDSFIYKREGDEPNGESWQLRTGYDPALTHTLVIASEGFPPLEGGSGLAPSGALFAMWREPQGEIVSPSISGISGELVFFRTEPSGLLSEVYYWDRPVPTIVDGPGFLIVHIGVRNPTGSRPGFLMRRAALCIS